MKKVPEWIASLKKCDKVPPGFYSIREIAAVCNSPRATMSRKLIDLESAGKIKSVTAVIKGHETKFYGK
jgi:predicted transcriptional regulator